MLLRKPAKLPLQLYVEFHDENISLVYSICKPQHEMQACLSEVSRALGMTIAGGGWWIRMPR